MIRCRKCHLAQCTCGAEDWEDYQTGGEAKAENASLRTQIEQLRQRVAELERFHELDTKQIAYLFEERNILTAERDSAYKIADHYRAERDALMKQRDELLDALETIAKDDSHNPSLMVMIAEGAIASVKEK